MDTEADFEVGLSQHGFVSQGPVSSGFPFKGPTKGTYCLRKQHGRSLLLSPFSGAIFRPCVWNVGLFFGKPRGKRPRFCGLPAWETLLAIVQ